MPWPKRGRDLERGWGIGIPPRFIAAAGKDRQADWDDPIGKRFPVVA